MWDNSVFTPETQIVCDSCGSKLTVYSRAQSAVNLVQKGWRTATTSDYGFFGLRCPKCAVKDREIVNTRDDSLAKLGYAFGCVAADAKLQEGEPEGGGESA